MPMFYSLPPLIASLGNLFLGGLVLGKRPNSRLHQVWALFSLSTAIWSFGFFMMYINTGNKEVALFWNKFYSLGMVLIPAVYFHFVLILTGTKNNKLWIISKIAYAICLAIIISIPTRLFNTGLTLQYWGYSPIRGITGHVYDVVFPILIFLGIGQLFNGLKTTTGRQRAQIKYGIAACFIGFGLGLTNFLPLYGINIYPLGHIGNFLANCLLAYSMVKYSFLEIEVIIRKSALYSTLTAIIGGIYVSTVFIFQAVFEQLTGYKSLLPAITVAIIVAVTFEPVRRNAQLVIDKTFFKQKYEYNQVVSTATEVLRARINPLGIGTYLLETIDETVRTQKGWIMTLDPSNQEFTVTAALNVSVDLQMSLKFDQDSHLVEYLDATGKPINLDNPNETALQRKVDRREYQSLQELGIDLIIPLLGKGKLIGILFVGKKQSGDMFTHNDMELLITLCNQAAISLENTRLYDELQASYLSTVRSLVTALEAKDEYTKGHSERVAKYTKEISLELGFSQPEAHLLYEVSLLHDVGKIGISEQILNKPAKLTSKEFNQIRSHAVIGERILSGVESLKSGLSAIRHHHERLNGSGYPDGLSQINIPLQARILAVADAYDAMTTKRPYRPAMSNDEAIQELKTHSCEQFDPRVVRAFISILGRKNRSKRMSVTSSHVKARRHLRSA